MLLKEALQLYQGHQIKVGADTSFIYCQICDENIYETINKLSDDRFVYNHVKLDEFKYLYDNFENIWKKRIKQRIELFKKRQQDKILDEIDEMKPKKKSKKKIESLIIELNRKYKKEFELELDEFKVKLNLAKQKDWQRIKNGLNNFTNQVENWKPFLEREVLEIYDAQLYTCKIVKFEGPEIGAYWDKDEYDKANRNK